MLNGRERYRNPRFGDLFCGCGGLSLGFKKAGFVPVFGIDSDKQACKVYEQNIKPSMLIREDIRNVKPSELPRVDILLGCPPCQGFSKINGRGRYRKIDDTRNNLVQFFINFVLVLKPTIFLFENVPQIKNDLRFLKLLNVLGKEYRITYRIVDLGTYGGGPWLPEKPATHRRRVVVIGTKVETTINPETLFPRPSGSPFPVGAILERVKNPQKYRKLGGRLLAIAECLAPGMPRNSLPRHVKERYFYPCWLRDKSFTDVFMRIKPEKPLPYVSSGFLDPDKGPFLHPFENRGYSVEEILSVMSFPNDYKLNVPMRKAAELLGNAFPPQAAYAFAIRIGEVLYGTARNATG